MNEKKYLITQSELEDLLFKYAQREISILTSVERFLKAKQEVEEIGNGKVYTDDVGNFSIGTEIGVTAFNVELYDRIEELDNKQVRVYIEVVK